MNWWVRGTKKFVGLWIILNTNLFLAINETVSISAFAYLLDIPLEITNSAIGTKPCAITAVIKKYKLIITKKKKSMIKSIVSKNL